MTATAITEELAAGLEERERVLREFLGREGERVARACHAMARSFARGGILIPFGTGAAATDAAHAAVEFMHPIIVGKRALPALAPSNDPTGAASLTRLGRGDDIALGLVHGPSDEHVTAALGEAARRGLLTISLLASPEQHRSDSSYDFDFVVPTDDAAIAQEVQETTYHVLWELVHVFFEHPGLLDDACVTCGDVAVEARVVAVSNGSATVERDGARENVAVELVEDVAVGDVLLCHAGVALERVGRAPAREAVAPVGEGGAAADSTGFLYPFLDSSETDLDSVLADVRASTLRKGEDVVELRRAIEVAPIVACAAAVRERLDRGGRLIAFGNGGSATDAQDVAGDCLAAGWPAASLTNDAATMSAIGNDVGYDKVFARQLIPLGRAEDVALAITTSGSSPNIIAGLEEARRRGMLTCAIAGYDGGRLAQLDWLDHLFVVPSDYVPRIQEAQASIYHLLLAAVGSR
jgi:D-sedoheptulose 7-phosphate isomerase